MFTVIINSKIHISILNHRVKLILYVDVSSNDNSWQLTLGGSKFQQFKQFKNVFATSVIV